MKFSVEQLREMSTWVQSNRGGPDGLISVALADAKAWAQNPSKKTDRISDQYWFGRFGDAAIDPDLVRLFVNEFMISRFGWDHAAAASVLADVIAAPSFDPASGVVQFSDALRPLTKIKCQQTSTASKFAMFARPAEDIFIWDQLASRAARLRDWARAGKNGATSLDKLYVSGKDHDYAAYAAACAAAWADERHHADFMAAVDIFEAFIREEGGPMADPRKGTREFLERRYLDKLMFAEGRKIESFEKAAKSAPGIGFEAYGSGVEP